MVVFLLFPITVGMVNVVGVVSVLYWCGLGFLLIYFFVLFCIFRYFLCIHLALKNNGPPRGWAGVVVSDLGEAGVLHAAGPGASGAMTRGKILPLPPPERRCYLKVRSGGGGGDPSQSQSAGLFYYVPPLPRKSSPDSFGPSQPPYRGIHRDMHVTTSSDRTPGGGAGVKLKTPSKKAGGIFGSNFVRGHDFLQGFGYSRKYSLAIGTPTAGHHPSFAIFFLGYWPTPSSSSLPPIV